MCRFYRRSLTLLALFPASLIKMIATVLFAPLIGHVMLAAPLGLVLTLHPDVLMAAFIPLIISRRINVAYTRWRVFVLDAGGATSTSTTTLAA